MNNYNRIFFIGIVFMVIIYWMYYVKINNITIPNNEKIICNSDNNVVTTKGHKNNQKLLENQIENLNIKKIQYPYGIKANIVNDINFNEFWTNIKKDGETSWEAHTFRTFYKWISNNTIYIGFGEWIGPTILFAANLAYQSYGIEPDNIAFNVLKQHVQVNPNLNIKVDNLCISTYKGEFDLGGNGDSKSTINSLILNFTENNKNTYKVKCLTIFEYMRINSCWSEDMFWKIDVEGAEIMLILSWLEVFKLLGEPKPILYISFHDTLHKINFRERLLLLEFIQQYKYVEIVESCITKNGIKKCFSSIHDLKRKNTNDFTDNDLCEWCDILLTDKEI